MKSRRPRSIDDPNFADLEFPNYKTRFTSKNLTLTFYLLPFLKISFYFSEMKFSTSDFNLHFVFVFNSFYSISKFRQ